MDLVRKFEKKKCLREIVSFVIISSIIFFGQMYINIGYEQYFWDCSLYHNYGCELFSSGRYDLHTLTSGFRGYIFPSLLGFSSYVDGILGLNCVMLKVFTSLIYGFFFSYLISRLTDLLYNNQKLIVFRIINLIVVGFFFWGLFIYPLTDMLGVVLCTTSVILLLEVIKDRENRYINCVKIFFGGLFAYAAYNVRSIYLFAVIVMFFGIAICMYKDMKRLLISEILFMLGILVCSIPQIIINKNLLNIYSIMLPTENLMLAQLNWGMQYQKYETYVGSAYESPALVFWDYAGEGLVENMFPINSFKDYLCRVLRYPFDFLGIYARHFVNMFLPIYPEQYIYNLEKNRSIYVFLNYVVLFIFGTDKVQKIKCANINFDKAKTIGLLALLFPSIAILPGALEQRFSLMMYILIIVNLVYGINYKEYFQNIKNKWKEYLFAFIFMFVVLLAIWGNTLSCLQFSNIIIGY